MRLALAACVLLAACDATVPSPDAGLDAGQDAGLDGGPPDGGPMCEPSCALGSSCCPGGEGAGICRVTSSDVEHCGDCGLSCIETGRGDNCRGGRCACGDFDLGCIGRFTSTCCVTPEGVAHCANLAQDRRDCGACGAECVGEQASQCEGGLCVCGAGRAPCAGTPEDRCCLGRAETYECVDTTTDARHCGDCGVRCPIGQRCASGVCVTG